MPSIGSRAGLRAAQPLAISRTIASATLASAARDDSFARSALGSARRVTGRAGSSVQPVAVVGEQPPLVEPVRAVGPEFDPLAASDAEARPMRRPRDVGWPSNRGAVRRSGASNVSRRSSGRDWSDAQALSWESRAAAGEIGVGFRRRDRFDRPFDPHLPAQRLPVEEQSAACGLAASSSPLRLSRLV